MTPGEFKAWFDGFTEAFTGTPTKAQWSRIKARVAEIDGKPVTQTVYVDRYLQPYGSWPYRSYLSGIGALVAGSNTTLTNTGSAVGASFNSTQAMADLGRIEASNLSGA